MRLRILWHDGRAEEGRFINTKKLAIRVDATRAMGTGHAMRCLALAQAWRLVCGGDASFLCASLTSGVEARIRAEGFGLEWLSEDAEPAGRLDGVSWAVLDGYHFDTKTQQSLRAGGAKLLVIDDYASLPRYEADLLLNQNLFAKAAAYDGRLTAGMPLLIGPEFALLRQELTEAIIPNRVHRGLLDNLLLLLGGADAAGQTARLAGLLESAAAPGKRISIVIGPGAAGIDGLGEGLGDGPKQVQLLRDPPNLPALFAGADLAISCSGVSLLELAAMGTPVLALSASPGERQAAAAAEERGFARNLGDVTDLTAEALIGALGRLEAAPEDLRDMSRAGQAGVDGQGAQRVVRAMLGLA